MSVNSTFDDFSPDTPPLSSNSSFALWECLMSTTTILIITTFSVTNVLILLPLSALIFYLGFQRWKQQRSTSTAAAATSHSDAFTFHLAAMEIITVLGSSFFCVGAYFGLPEMVAYGLEMFLVPWCIKIHFHTLTCVERYLAVVHPVTYRGLKNKRGVRMRNISIGCVWLLCVCRIVAQLDDMVNTILYFSSVTFASVVVCFCSLSVLRALRRPGPGEVRRDGEQVDQMKLRAFHTIVTIMAVLFLCLGGMLVCNALGHSRMFSESFQCTVVVSEIWLSLPSNLVLPLLFLHREGKLPGCSY